MTEQDDQSDATPKNLATALVERVVDTLVEELIEVIDGLGGKINADQLRSVSNGFKVDAEEHGVLNDFITRLEKIEQSPDTDQLRKNTLDRILIGRVESLFPHKGELGQGRKILSRRALSGLLEIIKQAIGTDRLVPLAAICDRELSAQRGDGTDSVNWSAIHKNQQCNDAVDEMLALFAIFLIDKGNQINWLVEQINHRLTSADAYAYEGGNIETWQLDKNGAQLLLRGLYSIFLVALKRPDGRDKLTENFSEQEIEAVEGILMVLRGSA